MRKPIIAGNWKMYKNIPETEAYIREFKEAVVGVKDREIVLGVPFTSLAAAAKAVAGADIGIAAQNIHWEKEGAFTGEISPGMVKATGAAYAIIGHSERRQYFGETDASVNRKLKAALAENLTPIWCIGESLAERESKRTFSILDTQLEGGWTGFKADELGRMVIAYEPVWAIGTGKTATPAQAEEVHKYIRNQIEKNFSSPLAKEIRILYGGSVKPDNIGALMAEADIDGALVGGASLKPADFARIVKF